MNLPLPLEQLRATTRRHLFGQAGLGFGGIALQSLLAVVLGINRQSSAESLTINHEATTYDHHPSSSTTDDGAIWLAWHGYRDGHDQILARRAGPDGNLGELQNVSESGSVHGPPTIIAGWGEEVYVVWTSKTDNGWRVLLRQRKDSRWQDTITLSSSENDSIHPTATRLSDGGLLAAWSEYAGRQFQIRGCLIKNGRANDAFDISSRVFDAFRPVLVVHNANVWALWDEYCRPDYSVHGRTVFPSVGDQEQVSPPGEYCLAPTALSHPSGLHVAWLRKIDVVGHPGVISQWHTLHTAVRSPNGWKQIATLDGSTTAAELTHGLLAKIDPRPVATGGYLGSRVRPSLLSDGERVWLLWERKSDHLGSAPNVTGDLVGRSSLNGRWQHSVVLQQGRIDYHTVHPHNARDGKVRMLASRLPRRGLRTYALSEVNLDDGRPFQQDEWKGWSHVDLPVRAEMTSRQMIPANGKQYKLFWADLHCHNGLTADAEGEPDEMHNYARDRAGLDVVVFTNNDFFIVPLTQYDFELGNLLAKTYSAGSDTQSRSLLSLPGFEWTSRIPGVATASPADSGNWLPPYRNRSFPNHRSVIYPLTGGPLVRFTEVGNDIARLNDAVHNAGGITLSQHSNFQLSGHPVEVGLELTSGWSNYIGSHAKHFHDPLNKGTKLGFTANGDTHRRAPGLSGALTGIYAEDLTADAILDALRKRRCFATMGSRLFVDARAGDSLMGDDVAAIDGRIRLTLHAIGTRPISDATLIRNGEEVYTVSGNRTRELKVAFTDENLAKGTHWYYWRIRQQRFAPVLSGNLMVAHGHLAWSSPHWVVVE